MPTLEAIRAALEKFVAGDAGEAEHRLIGKALRAGRLVLAEGERSVALGGSADRATILTGDGNVVLELDAVPRELRALMGPPVPRLTSDLADFTGREREIAALERVLGDGGGRAAITAIGGMGGVGKTALAVHVAHRLADRYPDGQIVIDLKGTAAEPLSTPAAMGRVIVALDPARKLPDDEGELAGLYRSLLSGKPLLILFDNAADAAQVRELLPAPPGAAIVTSRRAVVLPGLQRVPLDVLAPAEADALLLGIIGEGRASAAERRTLARRCGHLPLALRVAGTFLVGYADWGVAEYLAALADERERLKCLRIEGDALLDVAATLEVSAERLAAERPELVTRWRMLTVFPASFDRRGAAEVWAILCSNARESLSTLTAHSMVLFDKSSNRYRLHDLMRDVARGDYRAKKDAQAAEEHRQHLTEVAERHARYYRDFLAKANDLLRKGGSDIRAGLARFDLERANIEAGWAWAAYYREAGSHAARLCNDYPHVGASLLSLRQQPRDRIRWLEAALRVARGFEDSYMECVHLGRLSVAFWDAGEAKRAINCAEEALAVARSSNNPAGEAATLIKLGWAYRDLGECKKALKYHMRALEIVRKKTHAPKQEAHVLDNLGLDHRDLGDLEGGIQYYEHALKIARDLKDRRQECRTLDHLGAAYQDRGDLRTAIEYGEEALDIARELADRVAETGIRCNLGIVYRRLGKAQRAIEHHERYREIAIGFEGRRTEARALDNLGLDYEILGEVSRAIECFEHALAILQQRGEDPLGEAYVLLHLADCFADRGESSRAIDCVGKAQAAFKKKKIDHPPWEGHVTESLGIAHQVGGDHVQAANFLEKALAIKRKVKDRIGEGYVLGRLSAALKDLGEPLRAIEYAEQALAIIRDFGDRRGEVLVLNNLGAAYRVAGDAQRAIDCYNQALGMARELGLRREEDRALCERALALD